MAKLRTSSSTEELGYFYDTVHGRVSLDDLPEEFHPALKSALRSRSLDRLKRISQLGHTSVSFVSATHTRFSHAIGTMLIMNKLLQHVYVHKGIPRGVFGEIKKHYGAAVDAFGSVETMVHCHLLLAALYQDVGELPFQKVSSLFFSPVGADINRLVRTFRRAKPREWRAKRVFSVLSLMHDLGDSDTRDGFSGFDRDFLVYLLTGDAAPSGTNEKRVLLQLVDGVIDADRLDYVYRDAAATIGSLSRPGAVLETVVRYEPDQVIVSDPRPVTDFLSTRMRLFTFVYSAADVRFRQVLLKTVLDGRWDRPEAELAFKNCGLDPELPHTRLDVSAGSSSTTEASSFMELDDNSLMERISRLQPEHLEHYRRCARELLLRGTLDYECRVLKRGSFEAGNFKERERLPDELFFDLLLDHGHHQLYKPGSILVQQALTSKIDETTTVRLEESAGAFSPLFSGSNSAVLVPDGYYVFLPRKRSGAHWKRVEEMMDRGTLYPLVVWEDAERSLGCPSDTRETNHIGKAIGISYCVPDYPTVIRIVRELHRCKRRYRIFLRSLDGTGGTTLSNSEDLVRAAEAVIAVVSVEYLQRAVDGNTCINTEVCVMHDRAKDIPIVPIGVDERAKLNTVTSWNWGSMNQAWRDEQTVIPNDLPLRSATEETLRATIAAGLARIDKWGK